MGNCIRKCCDTTFECFGEFWSVHGIPIHFIVMSAMLCSMGLCPWIAMLGFIPASYLAGIALKKLINRHVKKKAQRRRMKHLFEELYNQQQMYKI